MKILKRNKWLQKSAAIVVVAVFAVVGALHVITPVSAADFTVSNETELAAALTSTDATINITITADFTINASSGIDFSDGKTVNINGGGHTVLRGAGMTPGNPMFDTYSSAAGGKIITITNWILDGNKTVVTNSTQPVIRIQGTDANVTLGQGVMIQNNHNGSGGGGVTVTAGGQLAMNGNATIRNCDSPTGGGLYINGNSLGANASRAVLNDNVRITNNTATSVTGGGVINVGGGFLTVNGNVSIDNNSATTYGGGIFLNGVSATSVIINGGTIHHNTSVSGGGIGMGSSDPLSLVINGGEITDNTSLAGGGGILLGGGLPASYHFEMNGGLIARNQSAQAGGGIYLQSSTSATIAGGEILDNSAGTNGGGIAVVYGTASLSVSNATVSGNTASTTGGGIYSVGTVTISGDDTVIGNNSSQRGGGIYIDGSMLHITGNTIIENNVAEVAFGSTGGGGGGLFVRGDANPVIDGNVKIRGNSAINGDFGGGGIMICSIPGTQFVIKDNVKITENITSARTGGISGAVDVGFAGITLKIYNNVSISNNQGLYRSGGAFIVNGSHLVIDGENVLFNNNGEADGGGAVFLHGNATMDASGVTFSNNSSKSDGGAIKIDSGQVNISNAAFSGNTAGTNGGAMSIPYANLANLNVADNVTFSSNSAHARYQLAPIDQPTYDAHIFATTWSNSVSNGYNNYDISYTNGEQIFLANFESNGGSNVARQEVARDETVSKPANPTRGHHTFAGWFTDEDLTDNFDFTTPITTDLVLYAKWTEDAHCKYNAEIYFDDENCVKPTEPTKPIVPGVPSTGWSVPRITFAQCHKN
jgi:uncharacterized repeat protein (TIGR02543 family)